MLKEIVGDIFDSDRNVIIHQCNCHGKMGGGIAKEIALRYPGAQSIDLHSLSFQASAKMSNFTLAIEDEKLIINLYSQENYGRTKRHTSYDAMAVGLNKINLLLTDYDKFMQENGAWFSSFHAKSGYTFIVDTLAEYLRQKKFDKIGIPYLLGCGLGGGNWSIVEAIIKAEFENTNLDCAIVKLPQYETPKEQIQTILI